MSPERRPKREDTIMSLHHRIRRATFAPGRRRRGIAIAASIAITSAAFVGLGATAAGADTVDPDPIGECHFGEHMVKLWMVLPDDLQADLKELEALEPGERGPFAREIRDGALGGDYGPRVQERAERVHERRLVVWATMPEDLKRDLLALQDVAPDERRAAAEAITQSARAGEYGEKVQLVTERIASSEFWQDCVAK